MEFVPLLAIGALTKKLVDLAKAIRTGDTNGALTMLAVAVAGVVSVLIASQTAWASTITLGGKPLGDLSFLSLVFVGVNVASFGALFGYDIPSQLDRSQVTTRRELISGDVIPGTPEAAPGTTTVAQAPAVKPATA